MPFESTILITDFVTHDVKRFVITRPQGLVFTPGQGVELAIDDEPWRQERRPFPPTSLPSAPVLEFVIKAYPDHHGVTRQLHALKPGARARCPSRERGVRAVVPKTGSMTLC